MADGLEDVGRQRGDPGGDLLDDQGGGQAQGAGLLDGHRADRADQIRYRLAHHVVHHLDDPRRHAQAVRHGLRPLGSRPHVLRHAVGRGPDRLDPVPGHVGQARGRVLLQLRAGGPQGHGHVLPRLRVRLHLRRVPGQGVEQLVEGPHPLQCPAEAHRDEGANGIGDGGRHVQPRERDPQRGARPAAALDGLHQGVPVLDDAQALEAAARVLALGHQRTAGVPTGSDRPASTRPTAGPRSGAHNTPSAPTVFKEPTAHWACDTWSAVASTRAA